MRNDLPPDRSGLLQRNHRIRFNKATQCLADSASAIITDEKRNNKCGYYFEISILEMPENQHKRNTPSMSYPMGGSGRNSQDTPLPFQVGFTTVRPGDVKDKTANLNFQEVTFDGKTIRVHKPPKKTDSSFSDEGYVANYPCEVRKDDKTDFVAGAVVGIRFRPLSDETESEPEPESQKGNIESQIDWTVDGKKWTTFSGLPKDQKAKINSDKRQLTVKNKVRVCFTASQGVVISMNMGSYPFVHAEMEKNDENQDLLSFSEENMGDIHLIGNDPDGMDWVKTHFKPLGDIKPLLKNACWSNFYMIECVSPIANAGIFSGNDFFGVPSKVKETNSGSLCSFDDLIHPPTTLELAHTIPVDILSVRAMTLIDGT